MTRWLVVIALCAAAAVASARPGGGHSYSSSSHASSSSHSYSSSSHATSSSSHYTPSYSSSHASSSSSSSHDAPSSSSSYPSTPSPSSIGYSPSSSSTRSTSTYEADESSGTGPIFVAVGGLALIGGIGGLAYYRKGRNTFDSRFESAPAPSQFEISIAQIRTLDPDFSLAVFEDFANQLYAAAQLARADDPKLSALSPYLSPLATGNLAARQGPVAHVVIGSLGVDGAQHQGDQLKLAVRIEANLVLDAKHTRFVVEHWSFVRADGVRTKGPERTRTWPCPSCGAPWSAKVGDRFRCAHCDAEVAAGKFDWSVEQIWIESDEAMGATLTGIVEEVGTEDPTVVDPQATAQLTSLTADDPAVTFDALGARVAMIYGRLNAAWNARDVVPARGLLTGAMLDYLTYWTSQYVREDLANHLDDAKLDGIELAKVRRDKFYDAVTVRVRASGRDYTTAAGDKLVGGARDKVRAYTEYWTLLRSSTRRGPIIATPTCPNCGAPLSIGDTGKCTHCEAIVDNGSFDWVLSKIEQDEAYRG